MSEEKSHAHDFHELGRVFPFSDRDFDLEYLSPHGLHDPETGERVDAAEIAKRGGKLQAMFEEKVPLPTPHVILQCQDPGCPDGPKHIEHVDLTEAEWGKLTAAHDEGRLDPDGNGTNRLVSTASLTDLGLGRIERMLGKGRTSGAREAIV